MANVIGTPTKSGLKDAAISYGVGMAGGLLYALSTAVTGSGLIGGLVGAGLAGSVIKGSRGEAIATILGFQTLMGAGAGASSAESAPQQEVM